MDTSADSSPETALARAGSGAMFDRIADRYDLLNRVMSFGIDRRWRRRTVEALALSPGARVLDLATGTADLALDLLRRHEDLEVVGLDPSARMLAIGAAKAERAGFADRFSCDEGVAESLPYDDASFDGACMAFGIRNCTDRPAALAEIARVLRPGARAAILELSEPRGGLIGPLARFHVHHVIPRVGGLLSGSREYRYLQKSIAAFPPPAAFAGLLEDAGLRVLEVVRLTFGTCHLYVAARETR